MPVSRCNESSFMDAEVDLSCGLDGLGNMDGLHPDKPFARQAVIDGLRAHIGRIEGTAAFAASPRKAGPLWTLGVPAVDCLLGPAALDASGVHEIRSDADTNGACAAAATAARRTFALLLGVRRMMSLERAGPILWALPIVAMHETGTPYSHGLRALGLDANRLIIVTPRKAQDVLWVLEEALRSGCLSMVLGEVAAVGTTASRRLSLAAAEAHCPCLLVSSPGHAPAVAVATRWRVAPQLGGDDPFDAAAPGARRFSVRLERCRSQPVVSDSVDFAVEWSDATRCFRMVAAVSARAPAPGVATPVPGGIERRIA